MVSTDREANDAKNEPLRLYISPYELKFDVSGQ